MKRSDIKKSEAYQSGFLEGTVPMYEAYMDLKKVLMKANEGGCIWSFPSMQPVRHVEVETMPFRQGIQQFLDDVNAAILSRGEDYYLSGQVESINWNENHVTAEVFGSEEEPYFVELDFSEDGEVEDWSCDCPYDWGPVCKHTAAVLLAIQAESPKESKNGPEAPKTDLRPLLESTEKSQLVALILEHCREDLRFRSRVLMELESSDEQIGRAHV